jgi:hypothetical protein
VEVERIRNELKAAGEALEEAKKQIEQKEKSMFVVWLVACA